METTTEGDGVKALALLEMRRCLAMIEHETATARREESLGGWLSDHTGAVEHWNQCFDIAKTEAQTHL